MQCLYNLCVTHCYTSLTSVFATKKSVECFFMLYIIACNCIFYKILPLHKLCISRYCGKNNCNYPAPTREDIFTLNSQCVLFYNLWLLDPRDKFVFSVSCLDSKGLSNPSEVEALRERVYASLEAYCKQKYPDQPGRYASFIEISFCTHDI